MVDDYYLNIFGKPMRKKREDQKKNQKKSERKETKEESEKKEKNGSRRRPKEESNDDTTEVKIEIGEEIAEFDLKEEEFEAVIPNECLSGRRGSIAEDVGSSLGDIGDNVEPEPGPHLLDDIVNDVEPEIVEQDVGEERRIYSDDEVVEEVHVQKKITSIE